MQNFCYHSSKTAPKTVRFLKKSLKGKMFSCIYEFLMSKWLKIKDSCLQNWFLYWRPRECCKWSRCLHLWVILQKKKKITSEDTSANISISLYFALYRTFQFFNMSVSNRPLIMLLKIKQEFTTYFWPILVE